MIDWAQFNWLDWAIVLVFGLSTLLSLWRGFAREALSLAGWIAAFLIANLFVGYVASSLAGLIENISGRYVAAYVLLFVGTLIVSAIIARMAAQLVKMSGLTLLDRLLGVVFGVARGVILIAVLGFVIRQLLPPTDLQWLHHSLLMPHVDVLAQWAGDMFEQYRDAQWTGITT